MWERAAVLILGDFAGHGVEHRDVLALEVGEPQVVVLVGSHSQRPTERRWGLEAGELMCLVVELGDQVGCGLTKVELECVSEQSDREDIFVLPHHWQPMHR